MYNELQSKIMKKNVIYTFAAGFLFLSLAACTKEIENGDGQPAPTEPATMITEVLSVKKEGDDTKVTMTRRGIFDWCDGEKVAFTIKYSDPESGATKYKLATSTYSSENPNKLSVSYSEGESRERFAVMPSRFYNNMWGGSDGDKYLNVQYPDNYDISTYVDAADNENKSYDGANGTDLIQFPMVALSDPESSLLTFYSVGALVRVVMTNVPAGTKVLYVTFNQTVTGPFTVKNPGTSSSYVEIPAVIPGEEERRITPSTVAITISTKEHGLSKKRNITLYIPVPTTEGLRILSSAETKGSIERNVGYSWEVPAIVNPTNSKSFNTTDGTFIIAPGNLLAYNNSGSIEYSFLSGTNQLITTRGDYLDPKASADPHENVATDAEAPAWPPAVGKCQDTFLWDTFRSIVRDVTDLEKAAHPYIITKPLTISGVDWYAPSRDVSEALIDKKAYSNTITHYRIGNKATVHGHIYSSIARVRVDVSGSDDYSGYALRDSKYVPGALLFPDGYVDQTDQITNLTYFTVDGEGNIAPGSSDAGNVTTEWDATQTLSFEAFEMMVSAGAIFLPTGGYYRINPTTGVHEFTDVGNAGLYLGAQQNAYEPTTTKYSNGINVGDNVTIGGRRQSYSTSIRLVRPVL